VLCSERERMRLLQLVGDLLSKGFDLVVIPGNDVILLLDGHATLAEVEDVESSTLVTISSGDDGLEQATGLGEERLGGLLGGGVGADTVEDVDLCEVAAVGKHVHTRHGSGLDVADDGDGHHCLASLISNHADKIEESGGGIEAHSEGVEDQAGLSGKLDSFRLVCVK
jgi:hypothetical protein